MKVKQLGVALLCGLTLLGCAPVRESATRDLDRTDYHYLRYDSIKRIGTLDREFVEHARADEAARRLVSIPGIGTMTATALRAAVDDGSTFTRARDLAAWLGLVPRQHTTGGKPKLLGISKRGNAYLRGLFIHGARAALPSMAKTEDATGQWLRISERRTEDGGDAENARQEAERVQTVDELRPADE